ncbi:MAG: helix-turn-helix transcriptional regulator [Lachnospiraceae bacterium]|nr:helix-turn-helix transcriptional regulator [Lachnospiraceae bacterium]
MKFPERLKLKRQEAGMTQEQLAKATGMTTRTIQNYEMGARRPKNDDIIEKLASAIGCTYEELMGMGDVYIMDAQEKAGAKAARDMEEIVGEVVGLFAGGSMDEEAMDGVYRALSEAYWNAKDKNKKYTPKKYRKDGENH